MVWEALIQVIVFLIETIVVVSAILITLAGIFAIIGKSRIKEGARITIRKLNDYYETVADLLNKALLNKVSYKKYKEEKKRAQEEAKEKTTPVKKRLFVIEFEGDFRASAVSSLREEITAILNIANPQDEVLVKLESSGGLVHNYGLAASQLQRIKDHRIFLTITVDKVAASGGYMMASVADQILAAPFSIVGSIGVIAQLPNFNRLLKKHDIDFEQVMGGKYKRTLTLFGENTREAREKLQEEVNEAHELFKEFVQQHRPQISIDQLSTGEHFLGIKALELHLVDRIMTSDDYLLQMSKVADIYEVHYYKKKKLHEKIAAAMSLSFKKISSVFHEDVENF